MAKYDKAGILEKIKMVYPIAAEECQVVFPAPLQIMPTYTETETRPL